MKGTSIRLFVLGYALTGCLLPAQIRAKRIAPVNVNARQRFDQQMKVAVLAGVGHYPVHSRLSELHYPLLDVELLAAELKRQGYVVVPLEDQDATRGAIEQALRDTAQMVDRGSGTVLFFFSGHGFTDHGGNYLATFEATASDLAGTGLSIQRVEELLKSTGAPRQVILSMPAEMKAAKLLGRERSSASRAPPDCACCFPPSWAASVMRTTNCTTVSSRTLW
jgi:hypothetical protein